MPIPEHALWPQYAPSFTLEIEKGNMTDENTEEYIAKINETFQIVSRRITSHRADMSTT
jgi:histone deacetylase 8